MNIGLKINEVPLELGREVPHDRLSEARMRRAGLWRRLLTQQPMDQTVYHIDDCEMQALDDELRIYPCTHGYLNRDRQWHTRVSLFVKNDRLHRILFQVVEGQTAALNFLERFQSEASRTFGEPAHQDRQSAVWHQAGTRIETYLHPDRINADFEISLTEDTAS